MAAPRHGFLRMLSQIEITVLREVGPLDADEAHGGYCRSAVGASVQSWVIQFIRGRSSPVQVTAACHREQDRWRFKVNTEPSVLARDGPSRISRRPGWSRTYQSVARLIPGPEADAGLPAAAPRRSGQARLPPTRPLPATGAPRCVTGEAGALPDLSPRRPAGRLIPGVLKRLDLPTHGLSSVAPSTVGPGTGRDPVREPGIARSQRVVVCPAAYPGILMPALSRPLLRHRPAQVSIFAHHGGSERVGGAPP